MLLHVFRCVDLVAYDLLEESGVILLCENLDGTLPLIGLLDGLVDLGGAALAKLLDKSVVVNHCSELILFV